MTVDPVPHHGVGEPGVDPGEVAPGAAEPPGYSADQHTFVDYGTAAVPLKIINTLNMSWRPARVMPV